MFSLFPLTDVATSEPRRSTAHLPHARIGPSYLDWPLALHICFRMQPTHDVVNIRSKSFNFLVFSPFCKFSGKSKKRNSYIWNGDGLDSVFPRKQRQEKFVNCPQQWLDYVRLFKVANCMLVIVRVCWRTLYAMVSFSFGTLKVRLIKTAGNFVWKYLFEYCIDF